MGGSSLPPAIIRDDFEVPTHVISTLFFHNIKIKESEKISGPADSDMELGIGA
jgi:hypothetical protein